MTAQFAEFVPPEVVEGDRYSIRDNEGHALIIKSTKFEESVPTVNAVDGAPAVGCDIVDLDRGEVFHDTLQFSSAIVDALKPTIGGLPIVVGVEMRKAKTSGRSYPVLVPATDAQKKVAQAYYTKNGDPFAPKFGDIEAPPF